MVTSSFEGSRKRACAKQRWNRWGAGFLAVALVLIMIAVDEVLHQATFAFICAVLAVMQGVPLTGDVLAGWWSPEILRAAAFVEAKDIPAGFVRVWHVPPSDESAWKNGIRWNASARVLFGASFYAWPNLRDACRYAPKADTTMGLVEILLSQALWNEVRVVTIPYKITWKYWHTVTMLALMLSCGSINPLPRRIVHQADIIVAPAQSMPWTCRQWVFRPTPTVRMALEHAIITYYPISWTK